MVDARTKEAVDILNHILEMELAGAIHYTHYSFMVYGYNRIPIVKWLEEQAVESMAHARAAGEMITQLGAHPSLGIGHCWKRTNTISETFSANPSGMKRPL